MQNSFRLKLTQKLQNTHTLGVAIGHLRSLRERGMVVHVHLIHKEMENVSMMYGTSLTMHFTTFSHPAYQRPR
ncbi:hypothetical protein FJD32_002940 [Shewanella sp. LC6]|jgi:hypothetical protein|nr:hypothetical protein CEQ32_22955 [Shewanella sp. FDAARGOS_354]QQK58543.1 hypothetical protein FJD32_002940 [Shewanella sp. LC6]TPE63510.1 hypothetical protein FJD33_03605 [Shewanella sp. LC2]